MARLRNNATKVARKPRSRSSGDKRPQNVCTICRKSLSRKSDLRRHIETVHPGGTVVLQCGTCHGVFTRKDALQRHKRNACVREPELPTQENPVVRRRSPRKVQKPNNGENLRPSEPRGGNTDDDATQTVLMRATKYFRVLSSTQNAFPSIDEEEQMTHSAWTLACSEHNTELALSAAESKAIAQRGGQVREELKKIVRSLVATHYGFKHPRTSLERRHTKELVHSLNDGYPLLYRDRKSLERPLENPIIARAIADKWFADGEGSEGVMFKQYFKPISIPTIALVLTVMENCVDEWGTGSHHTIEFSKELYQADLDDYLTVLGKWNRESLLDIRRRLYDKARR